MKKEKKEIKKLKEGNEVLFTLSGRPITEKVTVESMRWVEKHREEMKESATSPEEVSPAFRNIYRYRESLSKRILYQHYFIPKFEKFIQEHMR